MTVSDTAHFYSHTSPSSVTTSEITVGQLCLESRCNKVCCIGMCAYNLDESTVVVNKATLSMQNALLGW